MPKAVKILAALWIAVVLVTSGSTGMVLCVGSDGHISVEPAHDGHCHETSGTDKHDHADPPETAAFEDCHGSCTDLSLSADAFTLIKDARPDKLEKALAAGPVMILSADPCDADHSRRGRCPTPGVRLRPLPSLLALRTVVLRT